MLTRRRFLAVTAASASLPLSARAEALHVWTGTALGARATIRLVHPDAAAITANAMAEIDRLEDIFSLYRPDSALSRLNRDGRLAAPHLELLECLSLAKHAHRATGGLFDPTIQPLWALYAETAVKGRLPDAAEIDAVRARVGWAGVTFDSSEIRLRPGMALTLNGIAQGYIADRVAALLSAEGLTDILIDTGELRALGGHPDGNHWPVRLASRGQIGLLGRALATSAPLGTVFDAAGKVGHILNPATGRPAAPVWRSVSLSASSAGLADSLSTAACLMSDRAAIDATVRTFRGVSVVAAVAA
ncbi:FAD:protein FMN transferase [Defluviimonas aquaemixtae]|uniref:FAD:protein FMN transferase n=1 Tax=Albidovulum aquaemixtae TaxID=1542388 RepID=A0A2R8B6B8_9RHOB|nr:FAD:protein FMN transferase [Defluviimonas aquaemixtae]SPH18175.1 FAD:protein FMN transferase [Defluviimonas aquaemixtae]